MSNLFLNQLKIFFVLAFTCFTAHVSKANETATIQQMKGKKAILIFNKDIPFSVGQEVFINSADGAELGLSKEKRNLLQRKNSVSMTGKFSNLTQDGNKSTELSFSLLYAWNWAEFEFGPQITLVNTDSGGTTSSATGFGGYVDYNIDQNVPGQDRVWGLMGRFLSAGASSKTGSTTIKTNSTTMDVGLQAKFFELSQALAIRTELVYEVKKEKDEKDTTGFVFNIGLQNYF